MKHNGISTRKGPVQLIFRSSAGDVRTTQQIHPGYHPQWKLLVLLCCGLKGGMGMAV